MAILNPVFNMEHCKKMLRKARTRQASNEPNAETPIRVEMGYVHIYIYDISICNNVEFIKTSVLPAFQHPKTSKPFSLVSDVQHFEWADPANGLKADPQNWLKAHPKGTTLRFWGLGQGKLGFRGGTLGFGGWDMATWGLGVGLGDNPVGFGAIILRWSWVGGQLGKFKEHHHPPPTPHHQLRSISHVCKFHERHHPPKTTHGSGPRPTGQERAGSPQGQERGNLGGQDRAPFHFECIYIFLYSVNIVQYVTCSYPLPMATHITPVRTVPCRRRFWSNPIDIWARVDSPQVVQCHFGVRVRNDGVGVGFGKSQLESCFPFLANLWKMVVFSVKLCTPIKGYQGFCWTLREWKNGSLKMNFDFFRETNRSHQPVLQRISNHFPFIKIWEPSYNWNVAVYEYQVPCSNTSPNSKSSWSPRFRHQTILNPMSAIHTPNKIKYQ